ncbi:ABC transporter substrate-binding protein [Tetragenococcus koreensis]|uniref:Spermidine/putrescine ABC transporter substrate-binding protein n=1 Tax=Tetragenococcus koreensis TaxID=290335 RepID=A0AAN4UAT8_9ENTE|nr:ABC transporter substrate-binding protein [Tetragenococcus koreensis]AYW45443.1 spermidine/putrescine ABC transporter substrate-binding protein [Tetragenococcus koreensis]MCF1584037.1 ABC transporter substrate-binding protein [Tetragenococcus koreensis]MCF1613498.1 ABC transporter substrate-binding protein [Tetragenococcus koreensis]MCF1616769.1 ABC transporter substrate-binding protein [Tetragenococcus koreensis]MCF1618763.1 ABC transporter substrate-binding protein [Tetragenococcus koreen
MKRLQALFIGICFILLLLFFGVQTLEKSTGMSGAKVVNIYNWGDYIDPELIDRFEKESGYKVNYDTFDSNEAMFTKIQQGGTAYDIAIPSEYMIQKMIEQNLVLPLEKEKLKGLDNIDPQFLDLSFDSQNRYSVPYFWGTLGIAYNDKMVDEGAITSWDDLWSPALKNNVMLIDGAREIIGLGLNSLGYSLNSKEQSQLQEATMKLRKLTPNVKAIVADEIKMYMENEESAVAVTFSGEAADMMAENEHIHYVIPEEGSNLWFDNLVIPKTAQNKEGAYAFINFMLEPENAAQNAEYIGYSTPNEKALALLPKEITEDEQFYPSDERLAHLEVYENLGSQYLGIYNDLFLELKMYRK